MKECGRNVIHFPVVHQHLSAVMSVHVFFGLCRKGSHKILMYSDLELKIQTAEEQCLLNISGHGIQLRFLRAVMIVAHCVMSDD